MSKNGLCKHMGGSIIMPHSDGKRPKKLIFVKKKAKVVIGGTNTYGKK